MHWYRDHHPGAGGWLLMALLMLIFWGGVAAAIFAFVRLTATHGRAARPSGEARRLLDERFARGEIDAEEYVSRRELLDRT